MAKFRDLSQSYKDRDRSIGDRQRHHELVKEQMRANLPAMLEELNIFKHDSSASEIHKISVKVAKEFHFIYDPKKDRQGGTRGKVGQKKDARQGQILDSNSEKKDSSEGQAKTEGPEGGREPGRIILELAPEEIDDILDDAARDLNLPYLSPRRGEVEVKTESRWKGLKEQGIQPRLDLESSFIERTKRNKLSKNNENKKATKLINDDLRYHGVGQKSNPRAKVVVIFIMDTSGSMDQIKKYFAKAFCYALYNFVKEKYRGANIEMVFIIHDTEATEVDSADIFFRVSSNGGTVISSGPIKAMKTIRERFDPTEYDIYCVHCSDGENSSDDETKSLLAFKELSAISKLVGFLEIKPVESKSSSIPMLSNTSIVLAQNIKKPNFKVLVITSKDEVRPTFDAFLSIDEEAT